MNFVSPNRANIFYRDTQREKYSSRVTIMQNDNIPITFLCSIQEGARGIL